jgi:WD40 repeat protein
VWNGASPGERALVDASALRRVLEPHKSTLRLVVLSACHGGHAGAPGNALGAVALELHRVGVPAVVASREPLSVPGSITLARTLYRRLLVDLDSLEEAFLAARGELALDAATGDWSSLQLYARAAAGDDTRPFSVRPFRGLLPFTAAHHPFFFGREREVALVLGALDALVTARRPRFVLVTGASGAGKSSLIPAGVVPRLLDREGPRWCHAAMKPGRDPEAALDAALAAAPARPLLLLIDQLEEVFTATASTDARRRFVRRVWALCADPGSGVHVVVTLRADFLGRCGELVLDDADLRFDRLAFDEEHRAHRVFLARMTRAQFEAAITEPARRVGLALEAGLVGRLLDDAGAEPGALPLLEYALDLLWQKRAGHTLTQAAYDAVGGLAGALQQRADALVDALRPDEQRAARRLLVQLVTLPGDETLATRRRGLLDELAPGDAAEAERFTSVVARLVDERLLVRGDEGKRATVEIAHEALIRRWTRLQAWVREDRDKLLQIEKIAAWVGEWNARGALLAPGQLDYAEQAARRWPEDLGADAKKLLAASRAQVAWVQRRRWIVTAVFAAAAAVLAALGAFLRRETRDAVDQARKARDVARVAVASRNGATVATLVLREVESAPGDVRGWLGTVPHLSSEGVFLTQTVLSHTSEVRAASFDKKGTHVVTASWDGMAHVWTSDGQRGHVLNHRAALNAAVWSPDGARIVTVGMDGTARVWTREGDEGPALDHGAHVSSVAWSPDGKHIITAARDGTARVWKLDGAHPIATLPVHHGVIYAAAWSPDGKSIVTGSGDGTAQVWTTGEDWTAGATFSGHHSVIYAAAWSPDSKHVVTGSLDRSALVWSAADGKLVRSLEGHTASVYSTAYSPDGGRIVTASADTTARVWGADGHAVATLVGHTHRVMQASFAPDGKQIVTASLDKTARVWRVVEGLARRLPPGPKPSQPRPDAPPVVAIGEHTAEVQLPGAKAVVLNGVNGKIVKSWWSPHDEQVITASEDHVAQLWDAHTGGNALKTIVGRWDPIVSVAWSKERIVTAYEDGTARLLDRRGVQTAVLDGHTGRIWDAGFSDDGERVVTASYDWTARVWSAEHGGPVLVLAHQQQVRAASFSADGKRIKTRTADGAEWEWTIDPQHILFVLWRSTKYCLPPQERRHLLGEPLEEAQRNSRACESMVHCLQSEPSPVKDERCLENFHAEQAKALGETLKVP